MKNFFEVYRDCAKLAPLVREIGWSHNLAILEQCDDPLQREFYLRMTRKFGWSKNVLAHQIDNQSYEKSLLWQTNFDQTLTPALRAKARLAVKDEYAFDFLELSKQHSEREMEHALIAAKKPIGVATYEITKTLPKKLKDQLPSPEAIARLLEGI